MVDWLVGQLRLVGQLVGWLVIGEFASWGTGRLTRRMTTAWAAGQLAGWLVLVLLVGWSWLRLVGCSWLGHRHDWVAATDTLLS